MKKTIQWVDEERKKLEALRDICRKEIEGSPEGHIKAVYHGKGFQYYYKRAKEKSVNGNYVKKKDMPLVQRIVQRDYCKNLACQLDYKLKLLNEFEKEYEKYELDQIYQCLKPGRKCLVEPLVMSEAQYVEQWLAVDYHSKEILSDTPEIVTDRGEFVQSKSEKIIADKLFREGIPYRYEYPLELKGYGVVYPDFCVLNERKRQEIYWEHFGMMDDMEYCEKALRKIECYERNGYFPGKNLLITHETSVRPLNSQVINDLIEEFLR